MKRLWQLNLTLSHRPVGRDSGGPVTSISPFPLRTSLLVRARKTGRHDDKRRQIATKHDIRRLRACLKNPGGAAAKDNGRGPGGEVGAGTPSGRSATGCADRAN